MKKLTEAQSRRYAEFLTRKKLALTKHNIDILIKWEIDNGRPLNPNPSKTPKGVRQTKMRERTNRL